MKSKTDPVCLWLYFYESNEQMTCVPCTLFTNNDVILCTFEGLKASCTHTQTQILIRSGQISAHFSAQRSPSSSQMHGVLQLTEEILWQSYIQRGLISEELLIDHIDFQRFHVIFYDCSLSVCSTVIFFIVLSLIISVVEKIP